MLLSVEESRRFLWKYQSFARDQFRGGRGRDRLHHRREWRREKHDLAGDFPPDSSERRDGDGFMGEDLLQYPADKIVSQLGISHVPEGRRLFENLTVMENLRLATFARKDGQAIAHDLERVFSIFPRSEGTHPTEVRNTQWG